MLVATLSSASAAEVFAQPGDAAQFTRGERGQPGYVDYLNLIDADGSWRITNKVAQYVSRD